MVILVRCKNDIVTLALADKLEALIGEGLITAYLSPEGWVETPSKISPAKAPPVRKRSVARVFPASKPRLAGLAVASVSCDSSAVISSIVA